MGMPIASYSGMFGHSARLGTLDDAALIAGTEIATAMGWRRVEAISPGDKVLSFDHGMVPVREVIRHDPPEIGGQATPAALRPIRVAAGLVDNSDAFEVLPGSHVMIESDLAETLMGDPFVLVPAEALTSRAGVERAPLTAPPARLVTLVFDEDEIVFLRSGAMQLCARGGDMLEEMFEQGHAGPTAILDLAEARDFFALMDDEASAESPAIHRVAPRRSQRPPAWAIA